MPKITETAELKKETLLKDLDIPSVRERDPDPEAGPRLSITEFRLQGIVEYPDLGITRSAIGKIVEDIRFDMMKEGKLLESGRTLEELGELSNLLVNIENEVEQEHVGPLEVQRLIWLVREQQQKRGVTLGMIETVADRITRYYREHGFILAKAYIPEQKVRDGVVTLTLLLGVLGEIKVNENTLYDADVLSSVFDEMMTKPVTSAAVEENLYLINDLPGITTQGFFEAGSQVGDTRLNINVKSEEWFNANVRLDNHGSEETGENRIYSDFIWNNPTGTADQLHFGVLHASDPGSTTYGQIRYATNVFGPRLKVSLGYANNQFVLGDNNTNSLASILNLEGETKISDLSVSYKFKRSRKENYSVDFMFENVESLVTLGGNSINNIFDDEVNNMTFRFNYDLTQEENKMLHQGNVRIVQGDFIFGADTAQDVDYTILKADYSLLSFWQIPFTEIETRSVVRASLQVANTSLSSINQFSLGGPSRARGFLAKEFSADSALYIGADWFLETPDLLDFKFGDSSLAKVMTPFLFIDAAYGESKVTQLGSTSTGHNATLIDVGLGLQFSFSNNFNGNIQFAHPIESVNTSITSSGAIEDSASSRGDTKVLFELQYRF
jgi:hemolysin activation/secretion protein